MHLSKEWEALNVEQQSIIGMHQQQYPVKIGAIAKSLGIIVKKATLQANISGEIKESDGVVVIRVNRHDSKERQRFTLAHEIAHFLLHRHLLAEGITDDVLYRSSQSNAIEAEANRLAADIIMPISHTGSLMERYSKERKGDGVYEAVAEELDVSIAALKIRLGII